VRGENLDRTVGEFDQMVEREISRPSQACQPAFAASAVALQASAGQVAASAGGLPSRGSFAGRMRSAFAASAFAFQATADTSRLRRDSLRLSMARWLA